MSMQYDSVEVAWLSALRQLCSRQCLQRAVMTSARDVFSMCLLLEPMCLVVVRLGVCHVTLDSQDVHIVPSGLHGTSSVQRDCVCL